MCNLKDKAEDKVFKHLSQTPRSKVLRPMESYRRKEHSYDSLFTCWNLTNMNVFFLDWVCILDTLTISHCLVEDPGFLPEFLYLLHLLSITLWWRIQCFYTCYTYCLLSDVKDALDYMNAINQHSAHMHLFGL
jgi:hypothetical protein